MNLAAVLTLLLIHVCQSDRVRREIGDKCTTPNKEAGECRNLKNCPAVLEYIKQNIVPPSFLRESNCGFDGIDSLVCCPELSSRLTPWETRNRTRVPVTRAPTGGTSRVTGCGKSSLDVNRVVGGETASLGTWPWVAALGYRSRSKPGLQWLCGGALVSSRHVITAGHCVVGTGDKTLSVVRLGDLDLDDTVNDGAFPQDVQVERTIPHTNYKSSAKVNDIAIVKLRSAVQFTDNIRPICLPDTTLMRSNLVSKTSFVAGWGALFFRGPAAFALQHADLSITEEETCRRNYQSQSGAVIDNRVICASKPGKDACQGDSGGPLMLDSGTVYYLIGVVSYGKNCAEPNFPGVYTRVSTFMDWINANLN